MKFATGIIFAALLSLVLMAGAVFGLSRVCTGLDGNTVQRPALPVSGEGADTLPAPALLLRVQFADPQKAQATAPANQWRTRFLCQVKATDIALTGFGLFIVLALAFQGLAQGAWMRPMLQANARSARVIDETLISAQRAYVFLREFRVNLIKNSLNEEIQVCAIQPIWENTGTTPTRNGRAHVNWKFFERSIPAEFDFPDFDEVGNRIMAYGDYKSLIIGPRATALSPLIEIEPSILRQVRDLQGKVLIWGWAEYDEVFKDAERHRTEFCYQLVVTGSPMSWVGFSQYRTFNGADEDCTRKPTALVRSA